MMRKILWLMFLSLSAVHGYDPLLVGKEAAVSQIFDVTDATKKRNLPLRVYFPESKAPAPVILFSHGLGGSRDNNPYLGNHWAKRGYVVVFVQHPGSDEAVWKEVPALRRMVAMKNAASVENFTLRNRDIPAVIDTLTLWNKQKGHALHGRMNLDQVGMSGHSFGAVTTQAMAGQAFAGRLTPYRDARIDAALMLSPSPPQIGDPASAFAKITIPCLLMTGTKDDSPIGNSSPEDRLKVFPHLTQAPAWQVVFDGANHMSFGERQLRGEAQKDPRYHRAILALSTAFWDMHLKNDPAAKSWLNGATARSVLIEKDLWQKNGK